MILHFRQPKEAQVKTFQVQCLPNPDLCPTRTALLFQQRSSALRTNLATDHTFFLAYIEDVIGRHNKIINYAINQTSPTLA